MKHESGVCETATALFPLKIAQVQVQDELRVRARIILKAASYEERGEGGEGRVVDRFLFGFSFNVSDEYTYPQLRPPFAVSHRFSSTSIYPQETS